jgi:hypothetical protein
MLRKLAVLSVFAATLFVVSPGNMYHRVYAVVPLVGSGTKADPKRPMLVPPPSQVAVDRSGRRGTRAVPNDERSVISIAAMRRRESYWAESRGRISGDWSVYL